MNNRKRPAGPQGGMKLRSLRHINTKNLQDDANFFDASCSDDIIFSIASYLPSRDLVNLALTSKRFGGKRVAVEDVPQRSSSAHDMLILLKEEGDNIIVLLF